MNLEKINNASIKEIEEIFFRCCGSKHWVQEMTKQRPFSSSEELQEFAGKLWEKLNQEDWLAAFSEHPRIGDIKSLRAKEEQAGVKKASEETLQALAKGNQQYEEKNGFVFLVCATGKSADEMLELLEKRLQNNRETELNIAMKEQAKITALRLERIFQ